MIAEAFAYAIAVTLLIGLAAACVERFLAELGHPRRLAWLGAYAVAIVFPVVSSLLADPPPMEAALASSASSAAAPAAIDWDALLLRIWAAATSLLALGYGAAWIRLALLVKRWPRVAYGQVLVLLADDVGPAVLGVFRPRIVLPRWLAAAPEAVRSTVVAHELEHIAARDQAFIVAAQLATVLLPWNLPLWWFARRLRLGIEVDCDARVVRRGVDPRHYAEVLLEVGQRGPPSPYVATALIEPVTQLERRIRITLAQRQPGAALRATVAAALALAIAACATRVEAPAVVTAPEPPAGAAEASAAALDPARRVPFVFTTQELSTNSVGRLTVGGGTQPARFVRHPDGSLTVSADKMVLSEAGTIRITADRIEQMPNGMAVLGNVVLDFERTSITASRAVAVQAADGRLTVELEDAVVRRAPETAAAEDQP
jgi:hypothetical protein